MSILTMILLGYGALSCLAGFFVWCLCVAARNGDRALEQRVKQAKVRSDLRPTLRRFLFGVRRDRSVIRQI